MAGKGKLGKQASKGKAKRLTKKTTSESKALFVVSKGALRRLARRGGVKRISDNSYNSVREFCDSMILKVTKDSIVYAEAPSYLQSLQVFQSSGIALKGISMDKNGIEFIKVLDPSSAKFVRSSKNDILNEFSFDTEMALFLSKHYYFR